MPPNIIVKIKYTEYIAPSALKADSALKKIRDFYSCRSKHNAFDYSGRKNAADRTPDKIKNLYEELIDNTSITPNEAKAIAYDAFDYSDSRLGKQGSCGNFNDEGDITAEQGKAIKRDLQKTKSTIWYGIISFESKFGADNCSCKAQAKELMQKTFKQFIKKTHLKANNVNYYASLHYNTFVNKALQGKEGNYHIHFHFWEKEPIYTSAKGGKLEYSNISKIKPSALKNFKIAIANHFEKTNILSFVARDSLRKDFQNILIKNPFEFNLATLRKAVAAEKHFQLARLSKPLQIKIKKFAMDVVNSSKEMKEKYQNYRKMLLDEQNSLYKKCKQNNIVPNEKIKAFASNRIDELYDKLGNDVLKIIKSLEFNEVQQEPLKKPIPKKYITPHPFLKNAFNESDTIRTNTRQCWQGMKRISKGFILLCNSFNTTFNVQHDEFTKNKKKRESEQKGENTY